MGFLSLIDGWVSGSRLVTVWVSRIFLPSSFSIPLALSQLLQDLLCVDDVGNGTPYGQSGEQDLKRIPGGELTV